MTSPAGISFFWLIFLPLCDWATSVPASRWGRLSLDKQVVGVRCCFEGGDAQQLLLSESAAQAKQFGGLGFGPGLRPESHSPELLWCC